MPLFVVFAMTESNKDVPAVVFVATEWNRVLNMLRKTSCGLVEDLHKENVSDIIDGPDEVAELSAEFGWEPNFEWVTRHYVDIPASLWLTFSPQSYMSEVKLVIYESSDDTQLDLTHYAFDLY